MRRASPTGPERAPEPRIATGPAATRMYTHRAEAYHRFVRAVGYPRGLRAVLRTYPPLRADMKVLDAGCGSGLATLALRDALAARNLRPGPTHGFDLTPAMLDRFRANLARRRLTGVELRQADVLHLEALPEAWSGYDLILSSAMLEYVPRKELPTALGGLRSRLAADGAFLLFISRRNAAMRWLIERWWSASLYSREEIAACLDRAGFSRVRFLHFPPTSAQLALWGHVVEGRP